jgi:hypothetical protein
MSLCVLCTTRRPDNGAIVCATCGPAAIAVLLAPAADRARP